MSRPTARRRPMQRLTLAVLLVGILTTVAGCSYVTELYRHGGSQTVFYEGRPGEFEQRLATCGAVIRTIDPTTPRARALITLREVDRFDPAGVELRVWVSEYLGGTLMIVDEVVTKAAPADEEAAIRSAMEWFRLCQGSFRTFDGSDRRLEARGGSDAGPGWSPARPPGIAAAP